MYFDQLALNFRALSFAWELFVNVTFDCQERKVDHLNCMMMRCRNMKLSMYKLKPCAQVPVTVTTAETIGLCHEMQLGPTWYEIPDAYFKIRH